MSGALLDYIELLAFYAPVCGGIIWACICRVNLMHAGANRLGWSVMYTLFALYAGGEFMDVLLNGHWMVTHENAALVAIALNLWNTRASWTEGPAAVTLKG